MSLDSVEPRNSLPRVARGGVAPDIRSIVRRLEFRARVQGSYDALFRRASIPNPVWLWRIFWTPIAAIHDFLELLRVRTAFAAPGRPAEAALRAPAYMPQAPARHRAYWFERDRHCLVGTLMGIDLVRNSGKYFFLEANISPSLSTGRRALFDTALDPMIRALGERARAEGFRRVVMVRGHAWSDQYQAEFKDASREYGIEFIGRTMARDARDNLRSLPSPLPERTLYVVCSGWPGGPPLMRLLHEKWSQSEWLGQEMAADPEAFTYLHRIPTSLEPTLPEIEHPPAWPNLVLKLDYSDKGDGIAMGRFDSAASALRAFGIDPASPQSTPKIFGRRGPWKRLERHLYPEKNIFQPFVVPDLIEGHARRIRLTMLLSPAFDMFLSSYSSVAGVPVPKEHPPGLTSELAPYLINSYWGASYQRTAPEIEVELAEVAKEFGHAVRRAVSKRFSTEPESAPLYEMGLLTQYAVGGFGVMFGA